MKIYLLKTLAGNNIVFEENGMAKIKDYAPDGKIDGVDIYGENAIEELRQYFASIADELYYNNIYSDIEYDFAEIKEEIEDFHEELILIYED